MYFHHISTAYVAGKGSRDCPEEIAAPKGFHNPYESSKYQAEIMVVESCKSGGIGWSIYRPSIIIGDSVSGRALIFNGMYYPVKIVDYLQGLFRKDFLENNGQHAERMGVRLQPDGTLLMPIRVDKGHESNGVINLVTIDYVVNAFMTMYHCDSLGGIYHIVNERPSTFDTLASYTKRYFCVQGITPSTTEAFKDKPKTVLERRIDAFMEVYLPYMADCRRFTTARADTLLKVRGLECPEISYEIFEKCISYAVENQWESPIRKMRG
jgi:nucleoside-diphosphate-sugar epimerase